ncbi:hypothetical protein GCM10007872_33230 [Gluconobacter sphaericus NBRC 12467]|uniref:Uncharacterized protein n=1 Tax=Gluconobacter sphaericus NBRC 12467 TaxID=1307951 RepID=A0AA37WCT5_9PROT|nr:hypothetical protein GSP01_17390 [Gluconobacter sphaericus NBRC 12467]GLQ86408.1 hypothetical protein GCM10007872_33230 [Gluconobacter sphaericus NBRC 12467]
MGSKKVTYTEMHDPRLDPVDVIGGSLDIGRKRLKGFARNHGILRGFGPVADGDRQGRACAIIAPKQRKNRMTVSTGAISTSDCPPRDVLFRDLLRHSHQNA